MIDEEENKPVVITWLTDPSRKHKDYTPDVIYQRVFAEVFDLPDVTRSHVITLHLYVEYWLDRLLDKLNLTQNQSFHSKIEALKKRSVLEPILTNNLYSINQLRNIYAHELDLSSATARVQKLLNKLEIDPYFRTTDDDPLRAVCIQVMFLLEATFHNDCKPPKLPEFPVEEAREALITTGKLHWQQSEIVSLKKHGYIECYTLRCPLCRKGTIIRERDSTPGLKESFMTSCAECGLSGNGHEFILDVTRNTND